MSKIKKATANWIFRKLQHISIENYKGIALKCEGNIAISGFLKVMEITNRIEEFPVLIK